MGDEDTEIIAPAVAALRAAGIDASGPHSADALFSPHKRGSYDVAICMYHDQALIPVKMLDFWGGVNVTLGLPIIRTSPDHGTAFDIAGRGLARPDSLIAAIRLADEISRRRPRAHPASTVCRPCASRWKPMACGPRRRSDSISCWISTSPARSRGWRGWVKVTT